ncbi:MAG: C2H2-type zinc finger protein [Nitrosopumilus sp.]|nr:C2H2-type zinc finger protein [Nitrosopumilus sp.]MDH3486820.1 C2H2-type zinc finger protein [Nitrosopumilus sp.]
MSIFSMGLFGSSSNELKCKKCGTVLSDFERLKKHQEKAHNKKKEKCRVCGIEFDTQEDLRKHKKNCK